MQLILPEMQYKQSYIEYIAELGDEDRYPFPLDFDYGNFPDLLRKLSDFSRGVDLPSGYVPSTTYWLVDSGQLIGVSNLRHYLNDRIKHIGGHIGLGIRPSFRGKNLGTLLLSKTIEKATGMGVVDIHIHCHKDNQASARMILANGATLDSEVAEDDDRSVVQRYILKVASDSVG
jgi:predicted acetyltransferase